MPMTATDKWMVITHLLQTPSSSAQDKKNIWSLPNNSKVLTALPWEYVISII